MKTLALLAALLLCGCAMPTKESVCLGKSITGAKTTPFPLAPVADSKDKMVLHIDCAEFFCVIPKREFFMLVEESEKDFKRAEELQKQIDAAKPKCAELTVTEPSKSFKPPIKVERDS